MELVTWVIIGVLIVLAIALLKLKEIRHRLGLFAIISLLLFFVISVSYVTANEDVDLRTFEGLTKIGGIYFSWLKGALTNFISITGHAINQNWGLNATSST
jgi:hypothetical protein